MDMFTSYGHINQLKSNLRFFDDFKPEHVPLKDNKTIKWSCVSSFVIIQEGCMLGTSLGKMCLGRQWVCDWYRVPSSHITPPMLLILLLTASLAPEILLLLLLTTSLTPIALFLLLLTVSLIPALLLLFLTASPAPTALFLLFLTASLSPTALFLLLLTASLAPPILLLLLLTALWPLQCCCHCF